MQRVSDRSRYETWFQCPRKRYWQTEHNGRGITGEGVKVDLLYGTGIHAGLDELIRTDNLTAAINHVKAALAPIEETTPDGHPTRDELLAMGTGHLTIFKNYTLPSVTKDYNIISTEMEIIIKLSDWLTWMTRIDSSLERKRKGELPFVWEYKTSGYETDLIKQAAVNFQFHMESAALEEHYKTKDIKKFVGGCILLILSKGSKYKATATEEKLGLYGIRRMSPLTYAWWKKDPFITPEDDPKQEYSLVGTGRGHWFKTPTWIYPGTDRWLSTEFLFSAENLKVARKLITMPPSIPLDRIRFQSSKRQILAVEKQVAMGAGLIAKSIKAGLEESLITPLMDIYFPQNSQNCDNDAGYHGRCEYYGLCHEGETPDMYTPRIANHPYENNVLVPLEE